MDIVAIQLQCHLGMNSVKQQSSKEKSMIQINNILFKNTKIQEICIIFTQIHNNEATEVTLHLVSFIYSNNSAVR